MTIADAREKCKNLVGHAPRDVLIITIFILASLASFGLGYLAGFDAGQQSGKEPSLVAASTSGQKTPAPGVGAPTKSVGVVASKNGTKYYLPECTGANNISDANKVWFVSAEAARAAGYAPAANCKGL